MMASTTGSDANSTASQAAEPLKTALASADSRVTQGVTGLGLLQQARLSQATRTLANLKASLAADDPRVKAAEASVAATQTTIAKVALVRQQLALPPVQVAATGWALQGRVLDAQLQPAARFTVFLVDAKKTFLRQYGFAYTDETGYFVLNWAGETWQGQGQGQAPATPQLFVEVANTHADPVYIGSTAFQPVPGTASYQDIVLPVGGQAIGDPPTAIRTVALPGYKAE